MSNIHLVDWVCSKCGSSNTDDLRGPVLVPVCATCGAETEWWDICNPQPAPTAGAAARLLRAGEEWQA